MGDTRRGNLEEYLFGEVLLIVGLVVLALVQTSLLPAPLGFTPPLLLVVVVCRVLVSAEAPSPETSLIGAMRWAFYAGLALDLCASTPLGLHAVALLLVAVLAAFLAQRLRVGRALLPLTAVLLGTLAYEWVLAAVYHIMVASIDWGRHAIVILLPSVLLALIPTLPIFHALRWHIRRSTTIGV
jgi:rod shape-determining protein MreD